MKIILYRGKIKILTRKGKFAGTFRNIGMKKENG